jgi:hypothetical protein
VTLAEAAELERELDRLYGLPLGAFTQARNDLARRAREEGQRAIAARIGELRKPTLPAWVVNQLRRHRELDVQRLLNAGEQLERAQAEALRGGGSDDFLQARQEQQRALQRLSAAAREILSEAGRPNPSNLDRVLVTLRSAALSEEGRALLKQGRLTEEVDPPGFEALAGVRVPAARSRRAATTKNRAAAPPREAPRPRARPGDAQRKRKLVADARDRVHQLRARLRDREAQLRKTDRQAAALRKELAELEKQVETLERERRRAEDEFAAADRLLADLTAPTAEQ